MGTRIAETNRHLVDTARLANPGIPLDEVPRNG